MHVLFSVLLRLLLSASSIKKISMHGVGEGQRIVKVEGRADARKTGASRQSAQWERW